MTQTMLERAAVAVQNAEVVRGDLLDISDATARNIARAVLSAVRVPSEAMSQAVRTTEGWEDMIDFVMNEGEPK